MMESSSILPENPSVVVPSIGSLVRQEEDALLEPPSPVTTNDRAKLADSPSMDKENPSSTSCGFTIAFLELLSNFSLM